MLHHVSVGVADVARAARFYDAVLAALGYTRVMEFLPYAIAYGEKAPAFWITMPGNGSPPSVGNGVHIAFNAPSQQAVHAFHLAALSSGGSDEGAPGPRPDYSPNYYGGFVRDPDGNKIEAVFFAMQAAEKTTKPKPRVKRAAKPAKKPAAKRQATKPARKSSGRKPAARPVRRTARAKKR